MSAWPYWPTRMRVSSSQAEGAEREFQAATLRIEGKKGRAVGVVCARVDDKRRPVAATEFVLRADLVLIAIRFDGPDTKGLLEEAAVELDKRGNVRADDRDYRTSNHKVFVAGDMRRGQSLIVWAIREGRQAARAIDIYLTGESVLPA